MNNTVCLKDHAGRSLFLELDTDASTDYPVGGTVREVRAFAMANPVGHRYDFDTGEFVPASVASVVVFGAAGSPFPTGGTEYTLDELFA